MKANTVFNSRSMTLFMRLFLRVTTSISSCRLHFCSVRHFPEHTYTVFNSHQSQLPVAVREVATLISHI